mgnify:CR=1 FL=1
MGVSFLNFFRQQLIFGFIAHVAFYKLQLSLQIIIWNSTFFTNLLPVTVHVYLYSVYSLVLYTLS